MNEPINRLNESMNQSINQSINRVEEYRIRGRDLFVGRATEAAAPSRLRKGCMVDSTGVYYISVPRRRALLRPGHLLLRFPLHAAHHPRREWKPTAATATAAGGGG